VHHEALRNWIRQDEADRGERDDRPSIDMLEENRRLREEVLELRRANAILKAASAYFAQELDSTRRRSRDSSTNTVISSRSRSCFAS
jgi:transposase